MLYGVYETAIINSSTNASLYNQLLTSYSGLDVTILNSSFDFLYHSRLTYAVSASFATADTTLAAWASPEATVVFYVFRIFPASSETLLAVLNASPDIPFSIDARLKFKTNLDGDSNFSSYDKSQLTYTYSCTHPTQATDSALAAANNCCALVFSWNGTTLSKNK